MRLTKIFLITVFLLTNSSLVFALKGKIAAESDILNLKRALVKGEIKVGKTRLKEIRRKYGDAASIRSTGAKLIFDYGGLRIDFEKKKYFRDWEYDYRYGAAYTDDIDDLRFDLESDQLVGEYITFDKIRKDYDEPTYAVESEDDGEKSIYYYGEIKMTFENIIVVQSWRGSELDKIDTSGVLLGGQ